MPSKLINIQSADDLPKMIGWMIHDFRRDPEGKITTTLSNIMAPNKVKVTITSSVILHVQEKNTIRVEHVFKFETEDI